MGSSASSPLPLAPAFQRMSSWELKSAKRLLQDYKDKDLDFGLDAQALSELLAGDKQWATEIINAFGSTNGIVNALAFICGVCMACPGPALEKAGLIFDALDFDVTEQISMDEMTIVFLCAARGFCVLTGVGVVPSDEDLESVTLSAYRELNKSSGQSISKAEFTKWVLRFAANGGSSVSSRTAAAGASEVTIESALEHFGVVAPQKESSPVDEADPSSRVHGEGDNNPPADQHLLLNEESRDFEAEAVEPSAFDAAYEVQESNHDTGDGAAGDFAVSAAEREVSSEEQGAGEGVNAAGEPDGQDTDDSVYAEDASELEAAAEQEPREQSPPMAHALSVKRQEAEVAVEPDETQEYDQEFAPETPRNAELVVTVSEQAQDHPDEEREVDSSAEHVNTASEETAPLPPASNDEPSTSDEPREDSTAKEEAEVDTEAEIAVASDEQESTAADAELDDEQVPASPPSAHEPKAEPEALGVEVDAGYEDDGYDLPSARDDEPQEEAAVDASIPVEPTSEEMSPPRSEPLAENTTKSEAAAEPAAADDLNDFDAYDYTQPEFDASSGLPPPEDPADYADDENDAERVAGVDADAEDTAPFAGDEPRKPVAATTSNSASAAGPEIAKAPAAVPKPPIENH